MASEEDKRQSDFTHPFELNCQPGPECQPELECSPDSNQASECQPEPDGGRECNPHPTHQLELEIGLKLARRAYVYSLMHVVFGGEPTPEMVEQVSSKQTYDVLKAIGLDELINLLDTKKSNQKRTSAACADALRPSFNKLFQIPGSSYVHPWEAPYRDSETMVFQESTLDVRAFYHGAGFKLQAEKRFPDDHIAAMMDFMGRTSQCAYEAFADGHDDEVCATLTTQHAFVQQHLQTWVDDFAQNVVKNDKQGIYARFAEALAHFISVDYEVMEKLLEQLSEQSEV